MAAPKHRRSPNLLGPILFGLIFTATGALLPLSVLSDPRMRAKPQTIAICVGMAALFVAIGIGSMANALRRRNRERTNDRGNAFQRSQPWTERTDWARGEIESTAATRITFWWIFALCWNGMAWPVFWLLALPEIREGNRGALFAGLFPAVGIGLLIAAGRATIRRIKFGRCRLVMAHSPAPIGGSLEGRIIIPSGLRPDADPIVALNCVKRVTTGSGKNRRTQTYGLWHRDVEIDRTGLQMGLQGTEIPVSITIDADCRPTDRDECISWELSVSAKTPGIDFETLFVVPVFADPEGLARNKTANRSEPTCSITRQPAPEERLHAARIRWEEAGASEFPTMILPPSVPAMGTVVGLGMGGAMLYGAYLCYHYRAPISGAITLAFMGGLILLGILASLRGETRIILETDALVVTSRGLFGRKTRRVDPRLIRGVKAGLGGAQQGGSTGARYQVMLDCDASRGGAGIANALYSNLLQAAANRTGEPLDRLPGLPVPLGGSSPTQSAANDVAAFLERKLRERYPLAGHER